MKATWIIASTFLPLSIFAETSNNLEIPVLSPVLKPHHAVEYRRGAFEIIGWHFKQLGAMMKGELPFNKTQFSKGAEMVSFMSNLPLEGFVKDTEVGKEKHTQAKHNIWKNFADFSTKMTGFQKEAKILSDISKTGDETAIKKQFENTAKTCKSCHDEYRDTEQH